MKKEIIEKAQKEYDLKNYWRAKEIIRSSLGRFGYDIDLYSLYATILLSMHDKMQAGMYCFLSKVTPTKEEQEAIDLYLERHAKTNYKGILGSIPKKSRLKKLSDYPLFVQNRLKTLGAKEDLYSFSEKVSEKVKDTRDLLFPIGCLAVVLCAVICCIVGFINIVRWIF